MLSRSRRQFRLAPLAGSLLLHGLGLSVAAVVGVGVERREEPPGTFVLSLRAGPVTDGTLEIGLVASGQGSPEPHGQEDPETVLVPELLAMAVLPELTIEEAENSDDLAPELEPATDEAVLAEPAPEVAPDPDPPPSLASETAAAPAAGTDAIGAGASDRDAGVRSRPARSAPRHYVVADAGAGSAPVPVGPRPGQARSAARAATAAPAGAPRGGAGASGGGGRDVAGLLTPRPPYPRLSVRAGEEGSVLCRLHVSSAGKVTQVDIVESSGYERLDEAARTTLLAWTFEPRQRDGEGVEAMVLHRVTFRLEG